MNKKFAELPKKILVLMARLMYQTIDSNRTNILFGDELKDAVSPLGYETELAEDVSFLSELFKLNYNTLKEGKLNDKNIIMPELKKLKVEYYEIRTETWKRSYYHTIETYSTNEHIVDDLYFSNPYNYEDSIDDPYDYDNENSEYIDGDTENSGIKIVGEE